MIIKLQTTNLGGTHSLNLNFKEDSGNKPGRISIEDTSVSNVIEIQNLTLNKDLIKYFEALSILNIIPEQDMFKRALTYLPRKGITYSIYVEFAYNDQNYPDSTPVIGQYGVSFTTEGIVSELVETERMTYAEPTMVPSLILGNKSYVAYFENAVIQDLKSENLNTRHNMDFMESALSKDTVKGFLLDDFLPQVLGRGNDIEDIILNIGREFINLKVSGDWLKIDLKNNYINNEAEQALVKAIYAGIFLYAIYLSGDSSFLLLSGLDENDADEELSNNIRDFVNNYFPITPLQLFLQIKETYGSIDPNIIIISNYIKDGEVHTSFSQIAKYE